MPSPLTERPTSEARVGEVLVVRTRTSPRTTNLLAVSLGVRLRGLASVVHGVVMMAVGHMSMVTGFVMIAGFMVLRGLVVVPRGMLVMVGGLLVVLCDRMGHSSLLDMSPVHATRGPGLPWSRGNGNGGHTHAMSISVSTVGRTSWSPAHQT
jgi:hypothetical protein